MRYAKFFLSALGVLLLAAGAYAQPPRALTTIKLGYIPIIDHAPTFAALKNGLFEEEGLKADLTPMAGGAAIIPAVAGGSLDVGYSAYTSIFRAIEQGLDFTIIASNSGLTAGRPSYVNILVVEDSPIRRPKDFEGRVFSINLRGGIDSLYATEWVANDGGDIKKVIWQEIPFPNMGAALRTKKIDGMYGVEPFVTIELERGGLRSVGDPFSGVDPNMVIAGWTTTTPWIKKNQELGERFVRAYYKGIEFINKNPDKVPELLVAFARIPPAMAPKLRLPVWAHPMDMKALERQAELAFKWQYLQKKMDVNKIVWPTALR